MSFQPIHWVKHFFKIYLFVCFCATEFIKVRKGTEKASDTDIRRGAENAPLLVLARELHTFKISYYNKSKECLIVAKILLTHSHNLHFKITGLARRFLVQFNSVQLLSHVWLSVKQWTAACQASLFITKSWSLLKLMSIESVMPIIS